MNKRSRAAGRDAVLMAERANAEATADAGKEDALLPGGALAYYGDAVFEAAVRRRLLKTGVHDPGRLNRFALEFVTAGRQSEGAARLLPRLTEEEEALFRRGRNTVGRSPSEGGDPCRVPCRHRAGSPFRGACPRGEARTVRGAVFRRLPGGAVSHAPRQDPLKKAASRLLPTAFRLVFPKGSAG